MRQPLSCRVKLRAIRRHQPFLAHCPDKQDCLEDGVGSAVASTTSGTHSRSPPLPSSCGSDSLHRARCRRTALDASISVRGRPQMKVVPAKNSRASSRCRSGVPGRFSGGPRTSLRSVPASRNVRSRPSKSRPRMQGSPPWSVRCAPSRPIGSSSRFRGRDVRPSPSTWQR